MIAAMVSLGCAKNLVNSEQMLYLLREAGFEVTGETDGADVVIVNTCGFIESAKTEAIDTILELAAGRREGVRLVVTGCLAERYKDEILNELPEIDAVVGVGSFSRIVEAVRAVVDGAGEKPALFSGIDEPIDEIDRIVTTSPVWAYLKIAEGCDNRCAYCAIPDIRGKYRSRTIEGIVNEARVLSRRGIRELIIVAQDVTRYGLDLYGERRLAELIDELCAIDEIKWLRLHYLYPDGFSERLIDVIAGNEKVLKYLDIPIQHINDGILRAMNRRGTGTEIRTLIRRLRERIPDVVLRTSLITGLPGEGEREFEELCGFLSENKLERAGVFPYSPEEGTPAAEMARPDSDTAASRAEQIMEIQSRVMAEFNEKRIGQVTEVLIEGFEDGYYYGRSFAESPEVDGFVRVTGADMPVNEFAMVRITGVMDGEPLAIQCVTGGDV